eukprot:1120166-Rhodomonas_salina.6
MPGGVSAGWVPELCTDGQYQYSVDGFAFGPSRPSCVRHCGLQTEACGFESCAATTQFDPNALVPSRARINATSTQIVQCKSGFRVRSIGSTHATCSDLDTYVRWCGFCEFAPAEFACFDVRCDCGEQVSTWS